MTRSMTTSKIPNSVQRGVVVKFDAERGYGFIRPDAGAGDGQDVFVHVRNVDGRRTLHPGQSVSYRLARSDKGLTALDVQPGSVLGMPYLRFTIIGFGCAVLLLVGLSMIVHGQSSLALWLGLWVVSVSIATFGIYRYDKLASEGGSTRVPELVLHALSAVGGSPGAFIAMRWPSHHKTAKRDFQAIFWLIVAVQAGALIFWFLNR